jgi:hypothetical protein
LLDVEVAVVLLCEFPRRPPHWFVVPVVPHNDSLWEVLQRLLNILVGRLVVVVGVDIDYCRVDAEGLEEVKTC